MRDVPLCNPLLDVEAVGFQLWPDQAIAGVMITPWMMKLLLVDPALEHRRLGDVFHWSCPGAALPMTVEELPEFGRLAGFSLFSPMDRFHSQKAARFAAEGALTALQGAETADSSGAPPAPQTMSAPGAVGRRGLLRGLLGGGS